MKYDHKIQRGRYDGNIYRSAPLSQKLISSLKEKKIINPITDVEGLDRAYAAPEKLYVNGKTMYVAGTSNLQDVYDDLKIPLHRTYRAQRYKDADELLAANPQVENLVGHSLGGASVLELQRNHGEKTYRTNVYGTPALSFKSPDGKDNNRYRNYGDPVSASDRGAQSNLKWSSIGNYAAGLLAPELFWAGILDSHSYKNFDKNMVSDETYETSM
jgi:pimeloyl-ACP methyl ester carboxylesterase